MSMNIFTYRGHLVFTPTALMDYSLKIYEKIDKKNSKE